MLQNLLFSVFLGSVVAERLWEYSCYLFSGYKWLTKVLAKGSQSQRGNELLLFYSLFSKLAGGWSADLSETRLHNVYEIQEEDLKNQSSQKNKKYSENMDYLSVSSTTQQIDNTSEKERNKTLNKYYTYRSAHYRNTKYWKKLKILN